MKKKSRKKGIRNISGRQKYHTIFKMYDKISYHKIQKIWSKVLKLEKSLLETIKISEINIISYMVKNAEIWRLEKNPEKHRKIRIPDKFPGKYIILLYLRSKLIILTRNMVKCWNLKIWIKSGKTGKIQEPEKFPKNIIISYLRSKMNFISIPNIVWFHWNLDWSCKITWENNPA